VCVRERERERERGREGGDKIRLWQFLISMITQIHIEEKYYKNFSFYRQKKLGL